MPLPSEEAESRRVHQLRLQAIGEIRNATEAVFKRDYATARERLTLALAWIDEIEGKQKQ